MKNLFCIFLFFFFINFAHAQDKIVKINSDTILCKVLEVGALEVQFKNWNNLTGATQTLALSQVYKIIYEGGEEKVYTIPEVKKPEAEKAPKEGPSVISKILVNKKEKKQKSIWLNEHQVGFGLAYSTSNLNVYSGTIVEANLHYAYHLNERWTMKALLSSGFGYDYGTYKGMSFESENTAVGGGVSFHYNWISRERFILHSGLGIGFMAWEAFVTSSEINPYVPMPSTGYATPKEVAEQVSFYYDYAGLGAQLELIGADILFGEHFGITTSFGIGYSGIGSLGLLWAW